MKNKRIQQMRLVAEILLTIATLIMLWLAFDWVTHIR